RAALELVRPVLAGVQRSEGLVHAQGRAAQRLGVLAAAAALQAQDRPVRRAGAALDAHHAPADLDLGRGGERLGDGARDGKRAVEAVRATDAARVDHSTMSTRTRRLSFTAAALTTVRIACAVRPPRPITFP